MSGIDGKLWDFLAQSVEDYVKDKATVSEFRELYAERMSENRWANKNFNGIVDTIYDNLDNLEREYARKGDRDEDWMNDGVVALVDGHFANSVLSDRRASDALPDREYDQMLAAVEQFKRLTGSGRRFGGREERGRDTGRETRSTGRDLGRPAASGYRSGRDTGGKAVAGDHWSAMLNVGDDAAPEPERERERATTERYVAPHPIEIAQAVVEREVARPAIEGPDYTKARPWDSFYREGELWELAHKSKLKLTGDGSLESTIPTLYDCSESIKYFVMDTEGNVREELEPVTDENRYAQHETLNRSEDQPVAPKPQSAGFGRASLAAGKSDEEQTLQYRASSRIHLVDLIDEIKEDQLSLSDSAAGDHLTSAIFGSRAKLRASGDNALVDLHLLRTPIVATSFDQIELIEQVYSTSSLAGAQQKLVELKPKFDLPVWETLNKRYSEFLLRALRYQFQYNEVVKFNFAKHYQKLLDTLTADRGAEFAASFAERVGYITDLACGHFNRQDVSEYTADLFQPAAGVELPVVAFVDFISISAFNCTLDQLGIGNQLESSETGLVVNQTQHRDLNQALRKLYQNLDKALPAPAKIRVYLSTSDNRLVEVLPYANRMDTFILAAV